MNKALQSLAETLQGELFFDNTMRTLYATDASSYREMPLAVAIPKTKADIATLISFAANFLLFSIVDKYDLGPDLSDQATKDEITELVNQWQPDAFVVGLPLNMDGTMQDVSFGAKKFANRLNHRFNKPAHLQDERLTTVDARAEIFSRGGSKALSKDKVDGISACLIIEGWFEAQYN